MEISKITVSINVHQLSSYEDSYLAMFWHVAQANPAPYPDRAAGELVERIGREIIRRWLGGIVPELWSHQGSGYFQHELCKLKKQSRDGDVVPAASSTAEPDSAD